MWGKCNSSKQTMKKIKNEQMNVVNINIHRYSHEHTKKNVSPNQPVGAVSACERLTYICLVWPTAVRFSI